jgi:hypothetical protein
MTISATNQDQANTQQSLLRRTIDLWPYVLIAISITGLAYLAVTGAH